MQERSFFGPIIRKWPTVVAFAEDVGCTVNVAREWLRIDSIPATWFAAVSRAATERGWPEIDADFLAMRAERKRLSKSQPATAEAA